MGNQAINEISEILNLNEPSEVKLFKIKEIVLNQRFDVIPSLSEPNVYYLFTENTETKIYAKNKIPSFR